ncbi:MAG: hypothetical protein HN855_06325 [Anaerolineae bacterium]|jgi:hypothetical protein|nr:hypothetical protein [Anaerolineae bacterium]MBT7324753.1 hypothetical protein [Anaerolineae bacterium]
MKTYLFALLLVLQANTTGVSVRVLDAEHEPLSGVRLVCPQRFLDKYSEILMEAF